MSLQDTVFDLQFELEEYIQIAGNGSKPEATHPTMNKYHEIVKCLWFYEERSQKLAKIEACIDRWKDSIDNIDALYSETFGEAND